MEFFFSSRRRHTRSTRDWSSDVCSSDLLRPRDHPACCRTTPSRPRAHPCRNALSDLPANLSDRHPSEIGRASCRERVQISEVAVSLKKKQRGTQEQYHCKP